MTDSEQPTTTRPEITGQGFRYIPTQTALGWRCPNCGRGNAPWVASCCVQTPAPDVVRK